MTGPPDPLPDPPNLAQAGGADLLSDVLGALRLTGGVFLDAEFTAPWCITAKVGPEDCQPFAPEPAQVIAYHYVVEGRLLLQLEGEPPVEVAAGEIVLLPRNDEHILASGPKLRPVDAGHLIQPAGEGGLARIVHGGGGARTHLLCGFLGSDGRDNPVLASLPRVLKLGIEEGISGDWMLSSFRFAADQLRVGSAPVLAKLAELLFVEALRRYLSALPPEQTGWLAGLRDPVVGRALALLHGRVAHPWTTEELARAVGLSRSAFAARFTTLLGEAPMGYLARWRMQIAADRLRQGQPVARIAYEVGYESEAAFNRAFKRAFGTPPAAWRKGARGS